MIYFLLKAILLLFCCTISILNIVKTEKSERCRDDLNIRIARLAFFLFMLGGLSFQYYYIELFTPEGLEEAQKELEKNKVEEFKGAEEKYVEIGTKTKLRRYLILSKSQFKFVPQFGRFARVSLLGSVFCAAKDYCPTTDLEHIFYYHNEFERPNQLYRCNFDYTGRRNYMIGFHQTSREAALKISLSPMRITQDGMFGDGVYFAR